MAKAATKEKAAPTKDDLSDFEALFTSGEAFVERQKQIIPWSPAIDIGLGGGVPEGSTVMLVGPAKLGKTVAALSLAAQAQKLGKKVFYLAVEGRLKSRDLNGIKGLSLKPDVFQVIESKSDKILVAEEWLEIAEKLMYKYPGCVIIIDSFSMLCTQAESTGDMDEMQRGSETKLMYKFFRKVCNVVPVNNIIVIGIAHIIANPSGMGAGNQEKGGNAQKYAVDVKLTGKWAEKWTLGAKDDGEQIGQIVHWEVNSSAIGPPGPKPDSRLRYGIGFDEAMELIDIGSDLGVIEKGGAWLTLKVSDEQIIKCQGREKLWDEIKDNREVLNFVKKECYELLGIKNEKSI